MSYTRWIPLATLLMAWMAWAPGCAGTDDEPLVAEETVAQGLTQVTGFGSNPGNLQMFTYAPAGLPANAPVVLVLHGCTQGASAMEASGWTTAAAAHGIYLIYAQQQSSNNSSSCFNWFQSADISRGQGEALSLRQMVDWALAHASTDPDRVYVTGLSAGAFMAAVMAATYPDVFAGAAVHAGGPYRCATSLVDAYSCMGGSVNRTPAAWGELVRAAYAGYTGRRPRISLWHGTADTTVSPANVTESIEQWTNVFGTDQTPDLTETISGHTHEVYRDAAGNDVVEAYRIAGMGHAVPIDPQLAFPGGGGACGTVAAYFTDADICAVYLQEQFFGLVPTGGGGGDATPPTVQLTAPADGATVSGDVAITATASDDTGVARVELLVDGTVIATDTTAPYAATWHSAAAGDGAHVVAARALDAAGNSATAARSVTTANGSPGEATTVSFAGIAAEDGYVKALADGSAAAVGAFTTLAVGRGTDGKLNRAILSFDTSALPDGAEVLSATVTVAYASGVGSPWSDPAGNSLVVDVRRGAFGAAATTEAADWSAAASASAAAALSAFTSGAQTSTALSAAGLAAIDPTGRTQLRLRFAQGQAATAYVFLQQGAATTLTVTYR